MSSLLLRPLLRPQSFGLVGLVSFSFATLHKCHERPISLDSGPILSADYSYTGNAQAKRKRPLDRRSVQQISSGSIIGLCTGLAISSFSRSLALLLGLLAVGLQWASNHGINLIPYGKLQKYVTSIDLRSSVRENMAFKLSFGTTFVLAAFTQF